MSRLLETILGWLLDVIAFFDNIKARRGDDELTARHKRLQRSRVPLPARARTDRRCGNPRTARRLTSSSELNLS